MQRLLPLIGVTCSLALTACGGGKDGSSGVVPEARANTGVTTSSVAPTPAPSGDPLPTSTKALYISPTGSDSADCKSASTPCKTFASVFAKLPAGGELVLLDGSYTPSTTGIINWDTSTYTSKSAQIPSGTASSSTYVHALNPGKAIINGTMWMGRSSRKDSYISVRGLRFEGGVVFYNTSFVTLKETGVHGALDMGTNDGDWGNTDNLVEDVWVWASGERGIVSNYRSHRNVWRRLVVRGDGCGTSACAGDGNPNIGLTVYDSHDVSVQNVIVLDRILMPTDGPYADFSIASHTGITSSGADYRFGRNEWLGTISLNAPDTAYYMEPDVGTTVGDSTTPTIRISNAVAWNATDSGFNFARAGQYFKIENLVAHVKGGDAVRMAPELSGLGSLRNVIVLGSGRFGLNSAITPSYVNVNGSFSDGIYNQTTPTNVVSGDPLVGGALKYVTRVESTATTPRLSSAGSSGSDIGATVINRYGTDGARYGQSGYNTLTSNALWPWPNQSRIKSEMCANTTRGFCSTGKRLNGSDPVTLTSYVWEIAGKPTLFGQDF